MSTSSNNKDLFAAFCKVVADLRDPETGCPWDLEQDHKSLRPYAVEETYEVIDAIDSGDDDELCKELGDVLLQVVLHAQIAKERGAFSIDDVITSISDKMIRRHPHVFGETKAETSKEVLQNWEKIKLEEKSGKEGYASLLSGIPTSLPALLQAQRLGEKAAKVHFDWQEVEHVVDKLDEEISELKEELRKKNKDKTLINHELGDVLFSLSQLARWMELSAENSLRECCKRFVSRFTIMESNLSKAIEEHSLDELESEWQKAKLASE